MLLHSFNAPKYSVFSFWFQWVVGHNEQKKTHTQTKSGNGERVRAKEPVQQFVRHFLQFNVPQNYHINHSVEQVVYFSINHTNLHSLERTSLFLFPCGFFLRNSIERCEFPNWLVNRTFAWMNKKWRNQWYISQLFIEIYTHS